MYIFGNDLFEIFPISFFYLRKDVWFESLDTLNEILRLED